MAQGMVGVKVSLSVQCRIQTGPEGKANISETKPSVAQDWLLRRRRDMLHPCREEITQAVDECQYTHYMLHSEGGR